MAGFDVVAGGAVADIPVEGGVLLFVPDTASIAVTAPVASVIGGASALPPAATITVTSPVAQIRAGVLLLAPSTGIAIAAPSAGISISARVAAPVPASIALTAPVATTIAGGKIGAANATITLTSPLGVVNAGKRIVAPVIGVAVTAPVAGISISARIAAPTIGMTLTVPEARAVGGNFVDASNSVTITVNGGMIAGDSVAEFPVADGSTDSVTLRVPLRIILLAPAATINAGKSQFPPAASIALSAPAAEIGARRRKLRFMSIAS